MQTFRDSNRDQLAEIRNRKLGFVFQSFNLLSRTSARENAELPLIYSAQHLSHAQLREKADRVLASVGLAGREDHFPSQPSGVSNSASRSRVRRSMIRRRCWRMNRPAISTAEPVSRSWGSSSDSTSTASPSSWSRTSGHRRLRETQRDYARWADPRGSARDPAFGRQRRS